MRHEWFTILGNALLLLLVVALIFGVLSSCQPHLTYAELEEQASGDPKIAERLERFEDDAIASDYWVLMREQCASDNCYMFCVWEGTKLDQNRTKWRTIEHRVKWYRQVSRQCRFVRDGW